MWRELIQTMSPEATLAKPASDKAIARAEAALGVSFPRELASLLRETNGVLDDTGAPIIWTCKEIASKNIKFRTEESFADLYMPFDPLLFIGGDGGGDQFAYTIQRGEVRKPLDIFIWEHETDSRTFWAFTMTQFLTKALSGGDDDEDEDDE